MNATNTTRAPRKTRKVTLGTALKFERMPADTRHGPKAVLYAIDGPFPGLSLAIAYRIAPSRWEAGRWDLDRLPTIGPWEDATCIRATFATPEEAAAALVRLLTPLAITA